jgi:alanyl-tRNA synthetase
MNIHQIRQKYLDYFENHGHAILPSASLLPENDPTTLFTGSGMQPLVPYLLGETHPQGVRLANSQKCFRAQDIEDIGDNRHSTFFEMLGNWSLGDYFKEDQIRWVFNFLFDELGLNINQFYVTVYGGNEKIGIEQDNEAVSLWQELFASKGIDAQAVHNSEENGMQNGRIFFYDDTKNWWSRVGIPETMPAGEPGGPDTEMFWDFGPELKLHENSEFADQPCHVNCDCGRFLEIGNNVFMQYLKTKAGFEQLPNKNVDFGGGLERLAMALHNKQDLFELPIFDFSRNKIEELSGISYTTNKETTEAFRVILDHLRAATFLIGDGAVPSNKDQGYFTRRLLRRAIRFAHSLGINDAFCGEIAASYIESYKDAYPDLIGKKDMIMRELVAEEEKFAKTLERGLKEFHKILTGFKVAAEKQGKTITELSAKHVFKLYDTYGFPFEITEELAAENNLSVDKAAFDQLLAKHQEISKQGAEKKFKGGLADHSEMSVKYHTATHLLHQALRDVLGDHVQQKGSNITPDRLRFDFTHPEKMTLEQKEAVEKMVNEQIARGHTIDWQEMSVDDAKAAGAIGLFEDKYDDKVKVYSIGDYSKEICGGPHVENTANMGTFKIKKEEASSAGVRRIKAILQ